jgi:hypothetical protein
VDGSDFPDFPPQSFFDVGWETARRSTDLYWSAAKEDWVKCDAAAVTRIPGGGFGEPDPLTDHLDLGKGIWPLLVGSWQTAKMKHPDAIWSPRDGAWYDHRASGGGKAPEPGTAPSPARAALVQRLAEIERMYNAKPPEIDAARRQQLINQAFRDYEKQMGSPP